MENIIKNQNITIILALITIIILLIIIIYANYYNNGNNGNNVIENMTSENIEAIQNISSMMKKGSLTISNLNVTDSATIKGLNVSGNTTLNTANITSGVSMNNNLDIKGNLTTNDKNIRFTVAGDDAYIQTTKPNIVLSKYNSIQTDQTLKVNKIITNSDITSGHNVIAPNGSMIGINIIDSKNNVSNNIGDLVTYGRGIGIDTYNGNHRLYNSGDLTDGKLKPYFDNGNSSGDTKCDRTGGGHCLKLTKLY